MGSPCHNLVAQNPKNAADSGRLPLNYVPSGAISSKPLFLIEK
jgi:hypothetical protein